MTPEELKKIAPAVTDKAVGLFLPYINQYAPVYSADTALRMAAFIAQVLHESGCLRYVRELADGSAYEGREDLGNTTPGDGKRYKGRGLMQITGKANYAAVSKDFYGTANTLLGNPDLLATPENAVRAAYWFWGKHSLNVLADAGDFEKITRRINGGLNGQAERLKYYEAAKVVLGA